MYEVEQKFPIADVDAFKRAVASIGGTLQRTERHADTYYNHPSRDFAESREALRIRRVDGKPLITYKGPKMAGPIKARQEMEWRLDPGDANGNQTESLLNLLSFRKVATVEKTRQTFLLPAEDSGDEASQPLVVLDQVSGLGMFVEIELVVANQTNVEDARAQIGQLAATLGLTTDEQRSYLTMLLEKESAP
jgi:adenylate cyclase class 2